MVPTASVLRRSEIVGEIVFRSNRALCNTRHSIRLKCALLLNTMPMQPRAIGSQVVVDIDVKDNSPACLNPWARILILWLP